MPILDLVPFVVHDIIPKTWVEAGAVQGEHLRCSRALDKMMMKPIVRGNDGATFMPRTDNLILSLRVHERIALPGQEDDDGPGPMPVSFFIGKRVGLSYVCPHRRTGKANPDESATNPYGRIVLQLVPASVSGKKLPRQTFVFLTPSTVTASAAE